MARKALASQFGRLLSVPLHKPSYIYKIPDLSAQANGPIDFDTLTRIDCPNPSGQNLAIRVTPSGTGAGTVTASYRIRGVGGRSGVEDILTLVATHGGAAVNTYGIVPWLAISEIEQLSTAGALAGDKVEFGFQVVTGANLRLPLPVNPGATSRRTIVGGGVIDLGTGSFAPLLNYGTINAANGTWSPSDGDIHAESSDRVYVVTFAGPSLDD